jgi:cytosine/adenosine deaminase-related metal-dependent hydrolase
MSSGTWSSSKCQRNDVIEEAGAAVITNPQSNLNNAVGIADICKMDELGITCRIRNRCYDH